MAVRFSALIALAVGMIAALAVGQAGRPSLHRDGFAGREVQFQKADANIAFVELSHKISAEHHKSAATSELIKIEANPPGGATEAEFVHYAYPTPPAPLTERMVARLHVKAYRPGVQVKARVVLPRERDPATPDAPFTVLVPGTIYDKVRQWQSLGFDDPLEALRRQLPVLRARLGRELDLTDAYIDRLVLNVYAGPGVTEVWVDDLEIGPIRDGAEPRRPTVGADAPGLTASRGRTKAVPVEFSAGQILVDGDPFFMLGVRHTDTPLKVLRDAQFNTIFFPNDVPAEVAEDAARHGFWIVPTLPLPAGGWDGTTPKRPDPKTIEADADTVARYLRKFLTGDAVLMWDFGGGRTAEDLPRVLRAAEIVRQYDPRRPRSVDLWDGFQAYSQYVSAIGAHRWPLFSGLNLVSYKDWLLQRRALIPPGRLMWTWIQTHLPEWYVELLTGHKDVPAFSEPVGPHPEQIRILTYLSLAAGCRGLGIWSDKYLAADTHHGKSRLLELALLNAEIDMLKPVLAAAQDAAQFVPTSDPNVQAAIISGKSEILILPIWLGPGTQFTPPLGAVNTLQFTVPLVPDGATAWRITPAGVEELKPLVRTAAGTQLTLREFDLTAAIVITADLGPTSNVVRWQDHTKFRMGKTAAEWAQLAAVDEYEKTAHVHARIVAAGGPEEPTAAEQFERCREHLACAKEAYETKQWDLAYRESRRALRPLRVLMRADWDRAVGSLDTPTASPFAVSFYSLPEHWTLAQEVRSTRPAGNGLAHGGFELSRAAPPEGAAVDSLPGWKVRRSILDDVAGVASIVAAEPLKDAPPVPQDPGITRKSAQRAAAAPIPFLQPECGQHALKLELTQIPRTDAAGQPVPPFGALERTVLAVDSPPAVFAPGGLVRISFWVKTAGVNATADGLVVFDSAGGEALGVRTRFQPVWRQYRLYRRVPTNGKIMLTFALTGLGTAFIDDVKIEPMVPGVDMIATDAGYGPPRPDPLPPGTPLGRPRPVPPPGAPLGPPRALEPVGYVRPAGRQ